MNISRYFHTVKYLKPIQIRCQLWYRIRRFWRKLVNHSYPISVQKETYPLKFSPWIDKNNSFDNYAFTFLNLTYRFKAGGSSGVSRDRGNDMIIDWNFGQFGKLWAYNLNYMDCLLQPEMDKQTGIRLIEDFINGLYANRTGLDPYPIALRGINWIKFFSRYAVVNTRYSSSLYAQYKILLDNLEYHLLGNHLLEDGFSLLFGAFFFKDEKMFQKACDIIITELNEQILEDGAHFELSPMYHQIILDRLLDCINLAWNNNRFKEQEPLLALMKKKATCMIKWLNAMTFSNGQIPLLNDSAPNIAPTTERLNQYTIQLNVISDHLIRDIRSNLYNHLLSQSGYRRFNGSNYECIIDIGPIGPAYQPGHAHADTFSFVLNINDQPFIVDPGISTYESGPFRLKERGTACHNTVTVSDKDSSEVWSSFRVGNRANVEILKEDNTTILASHDGYIDLETIHKRHWNFSVNKVEITDWIDGQNTQGKAHFWFSFEILPMLKGQTVIANSTTITFGNADSIKLIKAQIPTGYNLFQSSYKLEITFRNQLTTIITPSIYPSHEDSFSDRQLSSRSKCSGLENL